MGCMSKEKTLYLFGPSFQVNKRFLYSFIYNKTELFETKCYIWNERKK